MSLTVALRALAGTLVAIACTAFGYYSFEQFKAELDYQTALGSRGVKQIQQVVRLENSPADQYLVSAVLAEAYEKLGFQEQARAYYERQITIRPAWPYAWYKLAAFLARNAQYQSSQFNAVVHRTQELGPYEWMLIDRKARLAYDLLGNELDSQVSAILYQALDQQLGQKPGPFLARAGFEGREEYLCAQFTHHEKVAKWCADIPVVRSRCDNDLPKTKKQRDWCDGVHAIWKSWL